MYLKTILSLEPAGDGGVRVSEIAKSLHVTRPSVSEALRWLRTEGLVVHPAYGEVRLSARGRRKAAEILHRFEVLRQFFVDVLHVDQRTAEHDACEIEHVVGPVTLKRLTAYVECATRGRAVPEQKPVGIQKRRGSIGVRPRVR